MDELKLTAIERWLIKAGNDLRTSRTMLTISGEKIPHSPKPRRTGEMRELESASAFRGVGSSGVGFSMSSPAGTRYGSYEIISLLGSGVG